MKIIKGYLEFIKESFELNKKIWKLSENDILQYFIEFKDHGWYIRVDMGFVIDKKKWNWKNSEYDYHEAFSELVLPGGKIEPAYFITINRNPRVRSGDLTDDLLFVKSILSDDVGIKSEIEVMDKYGSKIDIGDIIIDGGIFIGKDLSEDKQIELENYLALFIKTGDSIKITQEEVAKYYGWEYDRVDEFGIIYTHINLEDMADYMLSKNSEYKKALVGGVEYMWDCYENSDYIPDTQSLFQYTLNKENKILLIKSMIKESGGLEEFINHIGDECSDEVYDNVKGKSEEGVINYLLGERLYSSIKELSSNSEIYSDISSLVADWKMSAHVNDNYNELISEFDDIVGKEFEYMRIKKEVTKKWVTKDSGGEYKTEEIFYEIPYDNKWILEVGDDYDLFDLEKFGNICDIFYEYSISANFNYQMNPRITDWGDVDSEELNSEISEILNKYLEK